MFVLDVEYRSVNLRVKNEHFNLSDCKLTKR